MKRLTLMFLNYCDFMTTFSSSVDLHRNDSEDIYCGSNTSFDIQRTDFVHLRLPDVKVSAKGNVSSEKRRNGNHIYIYLASASEMERAERGRMRSSHPPYPESSKSSSHRASSTNDAPHLCYWNGATLMRVFRMKKSYKM